MKLTKKEMVEAVSKETGITQADCERVIDAYVKTITDQLIAGNNVGIHNFGTFSVRDIAERQGRNVRTKEPITIPACKRPHFSASPTLKNKVNP